MRAAFWHSGKSCASKHLDSAKGASAKIRGFWHSPPKTVIPRVNRGRRQDMPGYQGGHEICAEVPLFVGEYSQLMPSPFRVRTGDSRCTNSLRVVRFGGRYRWASYKHRFPVIRGEASEPPSLDCLPDLCLSVFIGGSPLLVIPQPDSYIEFPYRLARAVAIWLPEWRKSLAWSPTGPPGLALLRQNEELPVAALRPRGVSANFLCAGGRADHLSPYLSIESQLMGVGFEPANFHHSFHNSGNVPEPVSSGCSRLSVVPPWRDTSGRLAAEKLARHPNRGQQAKSTGVSVQRLSWVAPAYEQETQWCGG